MDNEKMTACKTRFSNTTVVLCGQGSENLKQQINGAVFWNRHELQPHSVMKQCV